MVDEVGFYYCVAVILREAVLKLMSEGLSQVVQPRTKMTNQPND